MKKSISRLLISLLFCLMLVGCGDTERSYTGVGPNGDGGGGALNEKPIEKHSKTPFQKDVNDIITEGFW